MLHKIGLFLPTLFGTPMICVYHADRNVLAHCMRPQKSLRWVWRLGERWTFRIDHGQSHVDVGHVVFIMICVHIQRNDSECQTFRSEVCRPPFEYGIRHYQLPILIRGVLTRQHVRYNATKSEPHSVFYWLASLITSD